MQKRTTPQAQATLCDIRLVLMGRLGVILKDMIAERICHACLIYPDIVSRACVRMVASQMVQLQNRFRLLAKNHFLIKCNDHNFRLQSGLILTRKSQVQPGAAPHLACRDNPPSLERLQQLMDLS